MQVPFDTLSGFRDLLGAQPTSDLSARDAAMAHNLQLTKPAGSLGRLEDLAVWVAGWQGREAPQITAPQVVIFAGNHGVCARGVSAYPAEVTAQMVINFEKGGAAVNQLSQLFGAKMSVHALELDRPTQDFTQGPAMTEEELVAALAVGWAAVDPQADLLVTGEMGIGNTTAAAALSAALVGGEALHWVGRGTGVDDAGLERKLRAVEAGLARHAHVSDPLQLLACFGGREMAAMAGAIAAARAARIPVILDGFICCAAALVLKSAQEDALDHCVAGHSSAEAGHSPLLAALGKEPLLRLGLRLGEGSGAALAIGVVQAAVACHSGMATFAQAGVSR